MLCQDYPTALPLLQCTEEDAKIYVGTSTDPVTHVQLRSVVTGRVMRYEATEDADGWYFEPDGLVIIGHAYLVQLLNGVVPLPFHNYTVDGYYSATPSDTTADGVFVVFERAVEGGDQYVVGDQFLSVP